MSSGASTNLNMGVNMTLSRGAKWSARVGMTSERPGVTVSVTASRGVSEPESPSSRGMSCGLPAAQTLGAPLSPASCRSMTRGEGGHRAHAWV